MKITKIRRTVTFGHYENISMEAEIEDGETIEAVDESLRIKIHSLIDDDNLRAKLISDRVHLSSVVQEKKIKLKHEEERYSMAIIEPG